MQTTLYLLIATILGIAAWWALKVSAGTLLPIERTARAYFFQLTKKMKLNQQIPESLANECVDESISSARLGAKFRSGDANYVRSETVKKLELYADMLRLWIRTNEPFNDSDYKNQYKMLFERHRVPRLGSHMRADKGQTTDSI